MFDRRYASSTVNTYISALGYSHQLMGLMDPTKIFYIVQILKDYGKLGFHLDTRLPITLMILNRLLMAVYYDQCQFRAMCALTFFAFLCVGEITATSQPGNCPIQLNQLTKLSRDGEVIGHKLIFADYKHNYNQRPFTMVISRQTSACPIQLLSTYLNHRGCSLGPVFMTVAGVAMPRKVFTANIVACLKYCDLSLSHYKSHSFRIGAASFAAENGLSDAQIHLLGRWKTNAFQKYIRVSSLSTTASLSE
jgi:hypothetical protein